MSNKKHRKDCLKDACLLESLESRVLFSGTVWYVSPTGNDSNAGTSLSAPLKTLQAAANKVTADSNAAGDTVIVEAGTYSQGFDLNYDTPINGGTSAAPITFEADPNAAAGSVIINGANNDTPDAIDVEPFAAAGDGYVTIKGFTIVNVISNNGNTNTITRDGIRMEESTGCKILNCTVSYTLNFGIFTSKTTNCLIQGNTVHDTQNSGEDGHGIYVSNSAVNPQIIGNTVYSNGTIGIHMNGDASQGGTGIITGALVADNVVYGNVSNGINCDGVQNSVFENNVIWGNTNHGIVLYQIDGGGPSTGNLIVNNTIYQPNSDGAAIALVSNASATIFNNILIGGTGGAISVETGATATSDYNVVQNLFTNYDSGAGQTLAQWQTATHQDAHSIVAPANIASLFVDTSGQLKYMTDYALASASVAINGGVSSFNGKNAPATDVNGANRTKFDIGAIVATTASVSTLLQISSASSATAMVGQVFSFTPSATGSPKATITATGTLPAGITFANNVLSGTPTVSGTFSLTFTAANGVGTNATQTFTLTVKQAPTISSANHTTFTAGTAGSFTVTVSGFPIATITSSALLPSGITLIDNHNNTATLSATTNVMPGTYTLTIQASNGTGGTVTQSFTLTISVSAGSNVHSKRWHHYS
jgi:parallel beta-helix repeat protein